MKKIDLIEALRPRTPQEMLGDLKKGNKNQVERIKAKIDAMDKRLLRAETECWERGKDLEKLRSDILDCKSQIPKPVFEMLRRTLLIYIERCTK